MLVTVERILTSKDFRDAKGVTIDDCPTHTLHPKGEPGHDSINAKRDQNPNGLSLPSREKELGSVRIETYLAVKGAAIYIPCTQIRESTNIRYIGDIGSHLKRILRLLLNEDTLKLIVRLDSNFSPIDPTKREAIAYPIDMMGSPVDKEANGLARTKVRYIAIISNPNIVTPPIITNYPSPVTNVCLTNMAGDLNVPVQDDKFGSVGKKYLILGIDGTPYHAASDKCHGDSSPMERGKNASSSSNSEKLSEPCTIEPKSELSVGGNLLINPATKPPLSPQMAHKTRSPPKNERSHHASDHSFRYNFSIGLVIPFEPRTSHVSLDGDGGLLIDTVEEEIPDQAGLAVSKGANPINREDLGTKYPDLGERSQRQHNAPSASFDENLSGLAKHHHHYFKPTSVQAMWSAAQCLHKILHEPLCHHQNDGCGGTRVHHKHAPADTSPKIAVVPNPTPLFRDWLAFYRGGGYGEHGPTTDPLAFREWHTLAPADESSSTKLYYDLALEQTTNDLFASHHNIHDPRFPLDTTDVWKAGWNGGSLETIPDYEQTLRLHKHCQDFPNPNALDGDRGASLCDVPGEGIGCWKKRRRRRQLIREYLKDIMATVDLEEVTCKYIRERLEVALGFELGPALKSFVDEQVIIILGQMESPTKVLDYLYLGSEWNASNLDELRANGIGYIINVTREVENFFPGLFIYQNIRVSDHEYSELLPHWDKTYKFITKARKNGSKVLIHCKMGVSRSASTVIAYIMKNCGYNLGEALEFLKSKRNCIKPNSGFLNQLEIYQGILEASQHRLKLIWRSKSESNIKRCNLTLPHDHQATTWHHRHQTQYIEDLQTDNDTDRTGGPMGPGRFSEYQEVTTGHDRSTGQSMTPNCPKPHKSAPSNAIPKKAHSFRDVGSPREWTSLTKFYDCSIPSTPSPQLPSNIVISGTGVTNINKRLEYGIPYSGSLRKGGNNYGGIFGCPKNDKRNGVVCEMGKTRNGTHRPKSWSNSADGSPESNDKYFSRCTKSHSISNPCFSKVPTRNETCRKRYNIETILEKIDSPYADFYSNTALKYQYLSTSLPCIDNYVTPKINCHNLWISLPSLTPANKHTPSTPREFVPEPLTNRTKPLKQNLVVSDEVSLNTTDIPSRRMRRVVSFYLPKNPPDFSNLDSFDDTHFRTREIAQVNGNSEHGQGLPINYNICEPTQKGVEIKAAVHGRTTVQEHQPVRDITQATLPKTSAGSRYNFIKSKLVFLCNAIQNSHSHRHSPLHGSTNERHNGIKVKDVSKSLTTSRRDVKATNTVPLKDDSPQNEKFREHTAAPPAQNVNQKRSKYRTVAPPVSIGLVKCKTLDFENMTKSVTGGIYTEDKRSKLKNRFFQGNPTASQSVKDIKYNMFNSKSRVRGRLNMGQLPSPGSVRCHPLFMNNKTGIPYGINSTIKPKYEAVNNSKNPISKLLPSTTHTIVKVVASKFDNSSHSPDTLLREEPYPKREYFLRHRTSFILSTDNSNNNNFFKSDKTHLQPIDQIRTRLLRKQSLLPQNHAQNSIEKSESDFSDNNLPSSSSRLKKDQFRQKPVTSLCNKSSAPKKGEALKCHQYFLLVNQGNNPNGPPSSVIAPSLLSTSPTHHNGLKRPLSTSPRSLLRMAPSNPGHSKHSSHLSGEYGGSLPRDYHVTQTRSSSAMSTIVPNTCNKQPRHLQRNLTLSSLSSQVPSLTKSSDDQVRYRRGATWLAPFIQNFELNGIPDSKSPFSRTFDDRHMHFTPPQHCAPQV